MLIQIDFESNEALYMQLHDQIIMGIARAVLKEGDQLPSVRSMADDIGINMHTVNKAYALLRDEGFLRLDQRRGAIVAVDIDRTEALQEMREPLKLLIAQAALRNVTREDVHTLVDELFSEYDLQV